MKLLIYGNRKQDDEVYDISTPEKESKAFLQLFRCLDEEWQVYSEVGEHKLSPCEPCQKNIHRLCENGYCVCEKTEQCRKRALKVKEDVRKEEGWAKLVEKARKGDATSAKRLLIERSAEQYEYEHIRITETRN